MAWTLAGLAVTVLLLAWLLGHRRHRSTWTIRLKLDHRSEDTADRGDHPPEP